jgi:hypothetical protein
VAEFFRYPIGFTKINSISDIPVDPDLAFGGITLTIDLLAAIFTGASLLDGATFGFLVAFFFDASALHFRVSA